MRGVSRTVLTQVYIPIREKIFTKHNFGNHVDEFNDVWIQLPARNWLLYTQLQPEMFRRRRNNEL